MRGIKNGTSFPDKVCLFFKFIFLLILSHGQMAYKCVCICSHVMHTRPSVLLSDYSGCDHQGEQQLQARQEADGAHSLRRVTLEFGFTFFLSDSRSDDDFQAGRGVVLFAPALSDCWEDIHCFELHLKRILIHSSYRSENCFQRTVTNVFQKLEYWIEVQNNQLLKFCVSFLLAVCNNFYSVQHLNAL